MEGTVDPHQTTYYSVNNTMHRSIGGSDNSLDYDNFANGNIINGENAHSTAVNGSGHGVMESNGSSSYVTAVEGGLRSLNATAHSLERHILEEHERARIRDQARAGYNESARGRVHEELAPHRALAINQNNRERSNETDALVNVAGLVFGGSNRTPFSGSNKQGTFSSYNRGTGQAFPHPHTTVVYVQKGANKTPALARALSPMIGEKTDRPPTPEISLYGLNADLGNISMDMRVDAEIEARSAGEIKPKGQYFVKMKLKNGGCYIEDIRRMRPWLKVIRAGHYTKLKATGRLNEDNEENGLFEIIQEITKTEFILYFKLHSIMPSKLTPRLASSENVAKLLTISSEQKARLDEYNMTYDSAKIRKDGGEFPYERPPPYNEAWTGSKFSGGNVEGPRMVVQASAASVVTTQHPTTIITAATPLVSPEQENNTNSIQYPAEIVNFRLEGSEYRRTLIRGNGATLSPLCLYLIFDLMRTLTRFIVPLETAKKWLLNKWGSHFPHHMPNEEVWRIVKELPDSDIEQIVRAASMPPTTIPEQEWHTGLLGVPLLRIHAGANEADDPLQQGSTPKESEGGGSGHGDGNEGFFTPPTSTPTANQQARSLLPGHMAARLTGIGRWTTSSTAAHPARLRLFENSGTPSNDAPQGTEAAPRSTSKKRRAEEDVDTATEGYPRDRRTMGEMLLYINKYISDLSEEAKAEGTNKEDMLVMIERIQECSESASRKWQRMDLTLDNVDKLVAKCSSMSRELEEREKEIAALKATLDKFNNRMTPEEVKTILDLGAAEEEWGKLAGISWPNEAFKCTKVDTEAPPNDANIIIVAAPKDTEGTAELLELDIPKAAKTAIKSGQIKEGDFAKICKKETMLIGGKLIDNEQITYVVAYEFDSASHLCNVNNLNGVLQKVRKDMPKGSYVYCTRTKSMQAPLRKLAEMQGRLNATENIIWNGRRKQKDVRQQKASQAPAARPAEPTGYAAAVRGTADAKELFPALGDEAAAHPSVKKTVASNQSKKMKAPQRPAILIRAEGRTVAEMTNVVRGCVGELGKKIVNGQMTREGSFKLEVNTPEDAKLLKEKFDASRIQAESRQPNLRMVVKGLDGGLSADDIGAELGGNQLKVNRVRVTVANSWGKSVAFCDVADTKDARQVLARGNVRIGYASCQVLQYVETNICYRCHAEGHHQAKCTSPVDYSRCCRKCKKEGHLARDCKDTEKMGNIGSSENVNNVNSVINGVNKDSVKDIMDSAMDVSAGVQSSQREGTGSTNVSTK